MLAKKAIRRLEAKKKTENKNDLNCCTEARNLWLSPRKMSNIVVIFQRSKKCRWCLKSEQQQDQAPGWLPKFVFLTFHTSASYSTDAVKTPGTDTSVFTLAPHMSGETCAERWNVYKILHAFKSKQENGPVGRSSHACDTTFEFDRICFKRLFREKTQQDSSRSRWTEGQSKEATSPQWIFCYSLTTCLVFADCGGAGVPGRAWTVLHNNPSSALASPVFFSLCVICHWTEGSSVLAGGMCVFAHTRMCLSSLFLFPRGQKITI